MEYKEYNKVKSNASGNKKIICILVVVAALTLYIAALAQFETPETFIPTSSEESVESVFESSAAESSEEESSNAEDYEFYDELVFESKPFANSSVVNGPLAVIRDGSNGFPVIEQSDMVNIGHAKTESVYGLSNMSLVLYNDAIANIDKFIVNFYEQVPRNGLIINKGYTPADSSAAGDTTVDLSTGYSVQFSIYNSSYNFSDDEFAFLREQAYKYGVIQRFPEGKEKYTSHDVDHKIYRYVGLAHSAYMNHYMYSLEEYIDVIRTHGVIEHKSELELGVTYVIYYVPVDKSVGTTYVDVPVADTYEYTVSGDGDKGFIVTVKIAE